MEDNDGFTIVTAANRIPKQFATSPSRVNTHPEKETTKPDEEMTEIEKTMTSNGEKLRICVKYGSDYNPAKGEMNKKGSSRLRELFRIMFDIDPSIQLRSAVNNQHLHQSAKFPRENDVQTLFQTEEYARKDGSGRTDYFVTLDGNAGDIILRLKKHQEFVDFLRGSNIFIFTHRHETSRVSTIGHIFNKLPEATNLDQLRDYLEAEMAKARGISTGDSTMNKIELSINRVYHSAEDETGQKFQGNTLAIQVVCASNHAKLTRELLTSGITGNSQVGDFVPRRQQTESPTTYLKVLVQHELFRQQHSIIRIKDLPNCIMDWTIDKSNQAQPESVNDSLWAIQDESGPLISSMDPAAQVPDDWFIVVPNEKIAVAKTLIQQILDSIATAEQFQLEFGIHYEYNPRLSHREDTVNREKQYLENITKDFNRDSINVCQVFKRVEQPNPVLVLKPTSYRTVIPPSNSSGVSWADMAAHNPPTTHGKPHLSTKAAPNTRTTKAFDRDHVMGFGRGGGIGPSITQLITEIDMMSVFTDDDASAHTTLSNVEARLAELHQANIDQNKIIAQQNAKIDSMQQEHERQ
jgi:hypothetical protein